MPIEHTPMVGDEKIPTKPKNTDMEFTLSDAKYTFEDIILSEETLGEIENVIALDKYRNLIFNQWGLASVMKGPKNISINLYGCSGTGKSMTAHAIASTLHKKILMVNYSEIESKYVGETSKNLVKLFESAQKSNAVILFDEADALLSKRVIAMNSATDVSVNQTRNVLLKILDTYQGVVIFTTNFIQNFDFAFLRRISSHIKFNMPNEETRRKLWEHYLVQQLPISGDRKSIISALSKLENITGADISVAILKSAVNAAITSKTITENEISIQVKKILATKTLMGTDGFEIATRKVSEEYVKDKLSHGGIVNGTS